MAADLAREIVKLSMVHKPTHSLMIEFGSKDYSLFYVVGLDGTATVTKYDCFCGVKTLVKDVPLSKATKVVASIMAQQWHAEEGQSFTRVSVFNCKRNVQYPQTMTDAAKAFVIDSPRLVYTEVLPRRIIKEWRRIMEYRTDESIGDLYMEEYCNDKHWAGEMRKAEQFMKRHIIDFFAIAPYKP